MPFNVEDSSVVKAQNEEEMDDNNESELWDSIEMDVAEDSDSEPQDMDGAIEIARENFEIARNAALLTTAKLMETGESEANRQQTDLEHQEADMDRRETELDRAYVDSLTEFVHRSIKLGAITSRFIGVKMHRDHLDDIIVRLVNSFEELMKILVERQLLRLGDPNRRFKSYTRR